MLSPSSFKLRIVKQIDIDCLIKSESFTWEFVVTFFPAGMLANSIF